MTACGTCGGSGHVDSERTGALCPTCSRPGHPMATAEEVELAQVRTQLAQVQRERDAAREEHDYSVKFIARVSAERDALAADLARVTADNGALAREPEWVVNSLAELGVKIGERFYFLYKGESLVYQDPSFVEEDSDSDAPIKWRPVGKREFGECCHPVNYDNPSLIGTVSPDDSDEWAPLPAPVAQPRPGAALLADVRGAVEALESFDGPGDHAPDCRDPDGTATPCGCWHRTVRLPALSALRKWAPETEEEGQ